ncbi:helix-turn-helix transcriptional regulator [Kovacikia minuta CCNUW1]|uniref:helix-turn-helix transcriptional regulator n=1 Tax=Kovacikia minuta TaxID=2931930 RepID=UPI001CCADC04|nr:helix-turn-helix transcriptional regulator [Kovacikia minuta]UBF24720.1 helix-turn-helix transcriptional regulator [Kovacikia minuta CCNUW1]
MKYSEEPDAFLQAVLEGFVDGIVVVTDQQEIIYTNATAQSICAQLSKEDKAFLPTEIQRAYEALVESRDLYGDRSITIESEAATPETRFRIRAQWLPLELVQRPCVLLRLQDQNQATLGLAVTEAQKWDLTPRETEVWLLRRSGCSYKEIAAMLYIAPDTVKKHLKNVHLKRQVVQDETDWQESQAS